MLPLCDSPALEMHNCLIPIKKTRMYFEERWTLAYKKMEHSQAPLTVCLRQLRINLGKLI